jgi:hypothetical protein
MFLATFFDDLVNLFFTRKFILYIFDKLNGNICNFFQIKISCESENQVVIKKVLMINFGYNQ